MSKVAIVKCDSYVQETVTQSVKNAIEALVDLRTLIKPGMTVLLKPNILMGYAPERAVTTHPAVLRAVCALVAPLGGRILIGDSGGFGATHKNAEKSGLAEVAREFDADILPFNDPVDVALPEGRYIKHFKIERAITQADVIINLPKLKTHGLTYFTGAAKNLYGCLPGLEKGKGHMKMPTRELFSELIVDLNLAIKPHLTVMDAVVGMEGHGPSNGDPRHIGLILAGTRTFDLDSVAAAIIGLKSDEVPYLLIARERQLFSPTTVDIVGPSIEEVKVADYQLIVQTTRSRKLRNFFLKWFGAVAKRLMLNKPVLIREKCRKCNVCVEVCPVKTISPSKGGPVFEYSHCIHCYCCQEMCPHGAIELKRKLIL